MLQLLCSKITFVLLIFAIIEIKGCKREDLHYVKITEKPKPLDVTKEVVNTFREVGIYNPGTLIVALEGLSVCRENIQEYEENLKKADIIEVHNHFVSILQKGDVQNLEKLTILYLDDNNIQEIQPGAFLNLPKLNTISLVNNTLNEIQGGVFNNLNNIEKIYLQNNKINNIAPEAFNNLPNIQEIDLSNNLLQHWNSNWFANSPKLNKILLNFNELIALPEGVFNNVKNSLEELNLSNNKLDVIDGIKGLKNLHKLYLENNKFKCVSDEIINGFPKYLTLGIAPNDNLKCLCWSKLEKFSFKYYAENKDTIFFTVRHAEIQCNNEIVGLLQDLSSRVSVLEKQ